MVLIKDDKKCQGTITFKKMLETVSMGKGNVQLSFISGEKALYRKPIQKSKYILHYHYLLTSAEFAYIGFKESACQCCPVLFISAALHEMRLSSCRNIHLGLPELSQCKIEIPILSRVRHCLLSLQAKWQKRSEGS